MKKLPETLFLLWFIFITVSALTISFGPEEAPALTGNANEWSFIVIGDTRDTTKATTTGISPALPALVSQIAAETVKPDFVIHAGDLTNGYWLKAASPFSKLPGKVRYRKMFANFLAATALLRDNNIPLYVVRGNHEFGGEIQPNTGVPELVKAYAEIFAEKMPQNGPANAKGLNYSFVHRSANFIVTDQYTGSRGTNVNIEIPWISQQLQTNTSPIVFAFGHSPAFRTTKTGGETAFQLANNVKQCAQFWNLLVHYKVKAFICSHEHFYTRGLNNTVYQILQGNGGASPMTYRPKSVDSRLTEVFPTRRIPAKEMLPGYLIVTINDETQAITVTEKCLQNGVLIVFDRFNL